MRLQDYISRRLYFPLFYPLMSTRANPAWRTRNMVRQKERLMRAPLADIQSDQAARLHDLLVYAARQSEFYRARFASIGLTDEHDLTIDNLHLIPPLRKHELQQNLEMLLASGVDRSTWRQNSSGGSSGETVVLMQDARYRAESTATAFVSDRMQGWDFGNRLALLWGGPGDVRAVRKYKGRLLSYLHNHRLYDSFDMGEERMAEYHTDLERFQPDNIQAYAGSAYLFASYLLKRAGRAEYPKKSIICSAESLTQEMRETIARCFRVPVYNRYGSREVGCIGTECRPGSGLHTHLDKIVEVLDTETLRPVWEEPGLVAVTCLSNYALPLIRYDLGDIGILTDQPCDCGVNTRVLRKLIGRSSDFISTPSGRMIHGEYFTHLFYGRRNIRQFQFVQDTPTLYSVHIVKNGEFGPAELNDLEREITSVLGDTAQVRFDFVEHIAPLPSGKFRFTVSNARRNGNAA